MQKIKEIESALLRRTLPESKDQKDDLGLQAGTLQT
jgi:hypothetical protein